MKTESGKVRPLSRNRLAFAIASTALALGAAALVLFSLSYPSGHLQTGFLSAALASLAAVTWLVLASLAVVARQWSPALVVMPLLLVVVLIASSLDLTLQARFAMARPAFEDAIAARYEADPGAPCPAWIGSYRIGECSTNARNSITRFYDRDGGFIDRVGFAYVPDGVPVESLDQRPVSYQSIGGPWYAFVETW